MKPLKNKMVVAGAVSLLAVTAGLYFGISKILYLKRAHATFENYYAFRGCTQLLERTQEYGICRTDSGKIIKIVKFQGRWFLDGDLPCGFFCW